ncbi:MAG: acyl-CoA dehydratase activase-related protein, partial [Oscillospiraceae bacterium]
MRIGVPGGLLFYSYEPFIRTFFNELGVEVRYSTISNKDILNMGTKNCVDEACLPIKVF